MKKLLKNLVTLMVLFTFTMMSVASAYDLGDYPKPFINNGVFDATLVIGNKAAAEDVIGVSGIASSLQYATFNDVIKLSETTVIGDAWQIKTSSKDFGISGSDGEIETINSIISSIGEDELKSLQDEEIRNSKGTAEYKQYINFENIDTEYVMYLEDDDDKFDEFLFIANGDNVMAYEIDFNKAFKSDIEDETDLEDYINEKIIIMGAEYTITRARISGQDETDVELTLMGGSVKTVLKEGETGTYTISGNEYEVTVTSISDSEKSAKFTVNAEVTDALEEGETYVLYDDTEIGVYEVIPNEAGEVSGGEDHVTFTLGATKMTLKDGDELEIGNERIDDTLVTIDSTNNGDIYSINGITIQVDADDDLYVEPGKKVSDYLDEPKALLGFDIAYEGLDGTDTEEISILGGEQEKELTFTDGSGNEVSVPIVYADEGTLLIGDDDDAFIFTEGQNITIDDYFILTSEDDSYVLQYTNANDQNSSTPDYRFKVLGGDTLEVNYNDDTGEGNIRLGGDDYIIETNADMTKDDFNIIVDLNGNGDIESNTVSIITKADAEIVFTMIGTKLNVTIISDENNCDDAVAGIMYTLSAEDDDVELDRDDSYDSMDKNGDVYTGYTTCGALIEYDIDENELVIDYSEDGRIALVYAISGDVVIEGTEEDEDDDDEDMTAGLVNKISVTATKLASEVSGLELSQNMIVVGGPCANSAASILMGSPSNCVEGFESGKGILKLFENNGNVAIVVAGFTAADTRVASAILSEYDKYILEGTEMIVLTATSTVTELVPVVEVNTTTVNETV